MIVDTRPQRGIRKQDNQVEFGKQLNGTRLPLAMSLTTLHAETVLDDEDYGL